MKAFEFAQAHTEEEILQLLSPTAGHTEMLAGGTDLVGLMKKMVVTPERVVNIMEVESMQQIDRLPSGELVIGAVVHLDDLLESPYLADYQGVRQAIAGIKSMQLQSQGTIGGEICQRPRCWYYRNGHELLAGGATAVAGDNRFHAILGNSGPAKFVCGSRIAPALIALGASARILGPTPEDEKFVSLETFYRTPYREGDRENVLLPNQLVTHLILPPADGRASATYEIRHGEGPDYPLLAAAAAIVLEGGSVRDAKIVLGQVAPTPWVSAEASAAIIGKKVNEQTATAAGEAAVRPAAPLSSNQYKVDLAKVAVRRAILSAAGLPTGGF